MIIGYARVSTDGQTLDAQQAALAAAGAEKVFAEKVSGAVTDRKAPAKAILALGPGDVQFNYYLKVNEPRFQRKIGAFLLVICRNLTTNRRLFCPLRGLNASRCR